MDPLLAVQHLVKTFPVIGSRAVIHAVNDVSLTLQAGEILGLVGESGSGKTTVGRCILGLADVDSGSIWFQGQDLTQLSHKQFRPLRRHLQVVFQDPYDSLNPRLTVGQIVEEPLKLWSDDNAKARADRIGQALDLVKVARSLSSAYPHVLTSGQQQRVSIARAIVMSPQLIVLDEPTSALDISVRTEIVDLLNRLQADLGLAYIFISHDLTAVREISDRIAVMYLGRIVEEGQTEAIFREPHMPYSKALLSSVLYPDPRQQRSSFVLEGEIPSPIDLPPGCHLVSRCPLVQPQCDMPIDLVEVKPGHAARCIRVQTEGLAMYRTLQSSVVSQAE